MKIGAIADSVRDQSTGIGFYTKETVGKLIKGNNEHEFYYLDFIETKFNRDRLININNPFAYFKSYFWHNYLPFKTKSLKIDLIFNFSGIPHLFAFKQKEIFFVYDISWYLYPKYHPVSRVLFYKLFFKKTLKDCFRIVADSESAKEDLIKIFSIEPSRISVIYPPLPIPYRGRNEKILKINFPYILFVGTLEPRKNIESVIKAFSIFKKKNFNYKLIICGKKGWLFQNIFSIIKNLKLENDIIYKGYITDREKAYLFRHADFFVYPSFYEGFGIPVFESFSYGCPAITSNTSSLPEVAGNSAILVDPKNVKGLANAMGELAGNPKLRAKLKQEGYKRIEELSKINNEQIKKLLRSLK